MQDRPLVSILIPCYNARQWVGVAIESALAQTYPHTEVIVVDDGSTDGSVEVLRGFDGRIRWETGPNRGGNPTRNRLLELAQGEWLQYLDADDWLKPDKIERQVADLEKDDAVDVLYSPVIMAWHEAGGVREEPDPIPPPHDPAILLAAWDLPQTGGPLWRKSALLDVGGWKDDQPCCQEHELYLRLLTAGKRFRHCPETGAVYRQWSDGTVCKRNVPLVHEKRLEIEDALENHLRETGALTPERLRAVNQARFEIARGMWRYNRPAARVLMQRVRAADPAFVPSGHAAPPAYQKTYRLLGFAAAERVADVSRRIQGQAP
ncbi:MAG: glycosyltransferase family 2 protein [Opitutales bacterium]|nr:glycosyltransferase family 2 protein [Opitutales bacterium]